MPHKDRQGVPGDIAPRPPSGKEIGDSKFGRCCLCGARLRSSNPYPLCYPCKKSNKFSQSFLDKVTADAHGRPFICDQREVDWWQRHVYLTGRIGDKRWRADFFSHDSSWSLSSIEISLSDDEKAYLSEFFYELTESYLVRMKKRRTLIKTAGTVLVVAGVVVTRAKLKQMHLEHQKQEEKKLSSSDD